MKTNLFSRFRNLFRKSDADYEDSYEESYEDYSDVVVDDSAGVEQSSDEYYEQSTSGDELNMPQGAVAPGTEESERGIHVPLAPIVSGLPLELQGRMVEEAGDLSVFLSLEQILPQLPTGTVSIPFGELRRAVPGLFGGNRDQDEMPINIPLAVVLPHISPDMLARRHGPMQMDIPDDIVSPFADKGKGLAIGHMKAASAGPTVPKATPRPNFPARPTAPAPRPAAAPAAPIPMSQSAFPGAKPIVSNQPVPPTGRPQPHAPSPSRIPFRPAAVTEHGTAILRKPAPQPAKPAPIPAPQLQGAPLPGGSRPELQVANFMQVAISAVADGWSEALKQEILQLGLAQSKLGIPYEMVEAGLKRGKLAFSWKNLKTWLIPSTTAGVSIHDNAELELPLRVIAPLFIAQQKAKTRETPKVAVDKDIPNLFFGLPQPDTSGVAIDDHAVSRPMDTNYYVWDDRNDVVADDDGGAAVAHAATAGTEFITRYATPNEVVSRAAALDGIEGAVIALPDGLMVASKLPPGLNGDTLAAFLPHLFGKVTQCTQELRMGELNNLNFTVGNVPWKIFRVNALYFAAFGQKGEQMPTAKLAALAGELDHKAKV